MKHPIGFNTKPEPPQSPVSIPVQEQPTAARKSVVRVFFPARHSEYSYYNDQFDLKVGDYVYVEGKLEGLRGRVTEVTYSFKIKLVNYKRVTHLIDMSVSGDFYQANAHMVTFDKDAIPFSKVLLWFKPPENPDDFVSGEDDGDVFPLNDLAKMKLSGNAANYGHDYFLDNRVSYLSLDNGQGHAIVEGSSPYEVSFRYENGDIKGLSCSCYLGQGCKHQFAAMLQLKETLELMTEHYGYQEGGYFAAISKKVWMSAVMNQTTSGKITVEVAK